MNIIKKLQQIADNFANGEDFLHADYETVCDAIRYIEEVNAVLAESAEKYEQLSARLQELNAKFDELQKRTNDLYSQSEYWQNIASR